MENNVVETLERLLKSTPDVADEYVRTSLAFSDDDDDNLYEEMERIGEEFQAEYLGLVEQVTAEWGKPTGEGTWEDDPLAEATGAIRIAYWKRD